MLIVRTYIFSYLTILFETILMVACFMLKLHVLTLSSEKTQQIYTFMLFSLPLVHGNIKVRNKKINLKSSLRNFKPSTNQVCIHIIPIWWLMRQIIRNSSNDLFLINPSLFLALGPLRHKSSHKNYLAT